MYHPAIVDRRLIELADADRAEGRPRDDWFTPVDRTRDECQQFADDFAKLSDERQQRPFAEERRWIRHEQLRCTVDFLYWLTRYARINNLHGRLSFFSPNVAQRLVLGQWAAMEIEELAIMMIQLKARQLGVTTLTEMAIQHRIQFYPDVNATVASATPAQSLKMANMMELSLDYQPSFLMPEQTARQAGKLIEFGRANSAVSIQHGAQFSGLSRGSTPKVVHLSEVASFIDAEDLIEASLLRAIHEDPWVFVILESTAEGLAGYWPKKWREAKQNWPIRQSRFMPIFLPWFIGRDLYPTEGWLKKQPIPGDWVASDMVIAHAERARLYVKSDATLTAILGAGWVMPREQMWFYQSEYEAAKRNKLLNKFLSEMPADEDEAFQSTNLSAFEPEVIHIYRNDTRSREPWGVFGLVGMQDEIPLRQQPLRKDIDVTRPRIPISCQWSTQLQSSYELVPLIFKGYDQTDPMGKFFIWEPPDPDNDYGMGCDTGDGRGLDGSALEMLRKGTIFRGPGQVAEFVSSYVNAFNLWPFALVLCTLYSPRRKQCRATIECLKSGESVQLEMRKRGWVNFHRWQRYDQKNLDPSNATRFGWFTNSWSRDLLMDLLLSALNDQWIELCSPYFVTEMNQLSRDEGEQSFRADYGGHDDRIMSLGMIMVSLHILELREFRARRGSGQTLLARASERAQEDSDPDPVYDPGWQGRDMDIRPARRYLRTMQKHYADVHRQRMRR